MKNCKARLNSRSGFTLIELMMAAAIFTIISSVLFVVLRTARNTWQTGDGQIRGQSSIRQGLGRMVKELRQTTASEVSGVLADGGPYTSITFSIPNGVDGAGAIVWVGPIQYSLDTSDANTDGLTNQLIRTFGGNVQVLANNINTLTFSRQASTPDLLFIGLNVQVQTLLGRTLSSSSETRVMFRN